MGGAGRPAGTGGEPGNWGPQPALSVHSPKPRSSRAMPEGPSELQPQGPGCRGNPWMPLTARSRTGSYGGGTWVQVAALALPWPPRPSARRCPPWPGCLLPSTEAGALGTCHLLRAGTCQCHPVPTADHSPAQVSERGCSALPPVCGQALCVHLCMSMCVHVCACMFRCEHVCTACERMCACVHLRVSVCCAYMCVRVCPSVRVYAAVCVIYAHHVCACVPLYECTWPCVCNLCTCMHWLCVCAHVCERQDSGLLRSHPGFDTVPGPLQ